jgi:hypothetical protein
LAAGFDPAKFGTHSLWRTKAALIYIERDTFVPFSFRSDIRRSRAVGYLAIEVDDAIEIAEKIDI